MANPPELLPPKDADLLRKIRKSIASGKYLISSHAEMRMAERKIILPDVVRVLNYGFHETSKDAFDEVRKDWKYAIRGRSIDERDIRIIVKVVGRLVIITVIDKDN